MRVIFALLLTFPIYVVAAVFNFAVLLLMIPLGALVLIFGGAVMLLEAVRGR